MTTVSCDRDMVVLTLSPRGRDLVMTPDQARRLAEGLRTAANYCEQWERAGGRGELVKGESRGAEVKSWDGNVNLRLDSITDRESIPYKHARQLAELIESKSAEAEGRLAIVWSPKGKSW